jgi:hypothetical protein
MRKARWLEDMHAIGQEVIMESAISTAVSSIGLISGISSQLEVIKMISHKILTVLLAILFALPVVQAAEPEFTFIQAGHRDINSSYGYEGDAWLVRGSYDIGTLYVFGSYGEGSVNHPGEENLEAQLWKTGFGMHGLLGERADLFLGVGYGDYSGFEAKTSDPLEGDGLFAVGGVRYMVLPRLELSSEIEQYRLDEVGNTCLEVRAVGFLKRFGVGAEYRRNIGADENQIGMFVRFNLGEK